MPSVPIQQFPTEDWSTQAATEDWSAVLTAQATEWVGTTTEWSKAVLPQTPNRMEIRLIQTKVSLKNHERLKAFP